MCRPDTPAPAMGTRPAPLTCGGADWVLTADDLYWQARQSLDGPDSAEMIRQALQLMPARLLDPMKAGS